MSKNRIIIALIILINIIGLIIPYSIKNIKLKENIYILKENKQKAPFIFKEKSVDYKSLEIIENIAKESGIENIKIETSISEQFGINIQFSAQIEGSTKLIKDLYNYEKDISVEEAKLNFDKDEESYIKFTIRGK